MLFNSCQFAIFFLMVTALYHALSHRLRWPMLLMASCYFYAVFVPKYLLILFLIILIDYVAALLIERSSRPGVRRLLLAASICANLGVLGFFKYGNFAAAESYRILAFLGHAYQPRIWHLVLPIGLSFHTFQSISYTVEVFRGRQRAERNLGIYSLYVLFYPQMVAGPIERPQNILPQLRERHGFDGDQFIRGIAWMLWGAFKKMIIADNLTLLVDPIYAAPQTYHGWPIWVATYAFAFQIYCDFSGYSDIARGAALAMGFRLMKNFDAPYHAASLGEFWRRWHISLSTWFRDYVYIPLGGSRGGKLLTYRNLLIVFLLSGLWHGASWAFIVWGALHGVYLIIEIASERWRDAIWTRSLLQRMAAARPFVGIIITFHVVLVSWVFFRAGSVNEAATVFREALDWRGPTVFPQVPLTQFQWFGLGLAWLVMEGAQLCWSRLQEQDSFDYWHPALRGVLLACGAIAILLWGRFEAQDFIYFQF